MSRVVLKNIHKAFGGVQAVRNISLEVAEGEFFSLLGPSGCGKTTTLRMIAGFEQPDTGAIHFDDVDVTWQKPRQRNVGMVFQNYALFPHMTVGENVAFGLKARKVDGSEQERRVRDALRLVDLGTLHDRPVTALSGGQQQRVALARALVIEPKILLLDEPLSNLDAKLRVETREQIRALQRRLGITTFYVTHDQDEALSQSDRLAVLIAGQSVQIGTPREVYAQPSSRDVMDFLGRANFLTGTLHHSDAGALEVQLAEGWRVPSPAMPSGAEGEVLVGFRPHDVSLLPAQNGDGVQGVVERIVYTGGTEEIKIARGTCTFDAQRLTRPDNFLLSQGDNVTFSIPTAAIRIFTAADGTVLRR